jgi:hypothetical protein
VWRGMGMMGVLMMRMGMMWMGMMEARRARIAYPNRIRHPVSLSVFVIPNSIRDPSFIKK